VHINNNNNNNNNKNLENIMKLYKKTTVYVVRCDKNNKLQDSAPCCNCVKILVELNIKKIVYSSVNNTIVSINPKDITLNHISSGEKMIRRKM